MKDAAYELFELISGVSVLRKSFPFRSRGGIGQPQVSIVLIKNSARGMEKDE
jgi:hypothetical protein